jgi:hypothetical protein
VSVGGRMSMWCPFPALVIKHDRLKKRASPDPSLPLPPAKSWHRTATLALPDSSPSYLGRRRTPPAGAQCPSSPHGPPLCLQVTAARKASAEWSEDCMGSQVPAVGHHHEQPVATHGRLQIEWRHTEWPPQLHAGLCPGGFSLQR